jgi:hypothetical protein
MDEGAELSKSAGDTAVRELRRMGMSAEEVLALARQVRSEGEDQSCVRGKISEG